ncbi:hypothetical protein H9Y04_41770 [Streptomyces sp. TRM66268-LWL]|uniref:Uncharacterized protein n=1 Tax=Streptomyces polyasparticus TaxID=2767826 RepID=A0ABR7SVX0_9ACTN|nr:hypothetical protein [Streptomyces polyasparticus]MBC9719072.1 hypothetical protein [Streptomyces polyasparticus]
MGDLAGAALGAMGVPAWLVRRMTDAARVAAHHVVGHSTAASYQLQVTADCSSVTVAVTDYDDQMMARPPAWLPVGSDNTLLPSEVPPGVDPLTHNPNGADGLHLHRTLDGYVRLGCQASWPGPSRAHPAGFLGCPP